MDVKEAVAKAKAYFNDVFEEKSTLEEVWFDEKKKEWCVTMGLRREQLPAATLFDPLRTKLHVDYKTVRIADKDGKIISIRIRESAAA